MKKTLMSFMATLFAAGAFAIPDAPCEPKPEVCCEEAKDPYAFSYAKDVGISCPRDFYVYGEYLLMQAKEDGLDYAYSNSASVETRGNASYGFPLDNGKDYGFSTDSNDWAWNSGVRAGFGFYLCHDGWSLDAEWMWLHIKQERHDEITGDGTFAPLWLVPGTGSNLICRHTSARWENDFNTIDLTLGKPHHVSRYFVLKPHFGVRFGAMDQDYRAYYGDDFNKSKMVGSQNYWGLGTRAGLDAEFLLGSNFCIFGKLSAAILYGKFDITQHVDLNLETLPDGDGVTSKDYSISQNFNTTTPNMDAIVGISWGKFFCKNKYLVTLKVAYEFHQWWNQNRFIIFFNTNYIAGADVESRGDFSINGFSFGLQFDF